MPSLSNAGDIWQTAGDQLLAKGCIPAAMNADVALRRLQRQASTVQCMLRGTLDTALPDMPCPAELSILLFHHLISGLLTESGACFQGT